MDFSLDLGIFMRTTILLFKNLNLIASYNVQKSNQLKNIKFSRFQTFNWNRNANVAIGKIPNSNGLVLYCYILLLGSLLTQVNDQYSKLRNATLLNPKIKLFGRVQ